MIVEELQPEDATSPVTTVEKGITIYIPVFMPTAMQIIPSCFVYATVG